MFSIELDLAENIFCEFCIKCLWMQHLYTFLQLFEICFIVSKVPLIVPLAVLTEWRRNREQTNGQEREVGRWGRQWDAMKNQNIPHAVLHLVGSDLIYHHQQIYIWMNLCMATLFVWEMSDERCVLTAWWFTQFGWNLIRTKENRKSNWNSRKKNSVRATCEVWMKSNSSSSNSRN